MGSQESDTAGQLHFRAIMCLDETSAYGNGVVGWIFSPERSNFSMYNQEVFVHSSVHKSSTFNFL